MPISRSENMRRIKSGDTIPEMAVRRLVHRLGYRYRLHRRDLPGRPDLVFPARKKILFVHGCFWHQHAVKQCSDSRVPKSNTTYWTPKLKANTERDARNIAALEEAGWKVLVLWECEIATAIDLKARITRFLGRR